MNTLQRICSGAVDHLRRGGLLIYPTETSYAIGCDATNVRAVRAIFRLKGREGGKPLPFIVASRAMAERYARFTPLARRLARRHWPGPLTLVLAQDFSPSLDRRGNDSPRPERRGRGRERLAPGVIAANETIALRVSSHPIARALSRHLGRPIVSTSANRSGDPPVFSIREATAALASAVRRLGITFVAFDGGALPRCSPSMIVDARGVHQVILRPRRLMKKV